MRTTRLLAGCAFGAILASLSTAAAAQSFNGTPNVVAGAANVVTAPNTTNVLVGLPETVINWTSTIGADPRAINFQPNGTTANFSGARGLSDYTVLNRILPVDGSGNPVAATVAFNGAVDSTLFGGARGGNIWFYSPTGIIAGPTAAFNVGSLILTTDDIQFVPGVPDVSNGSIYGPGGLIQFRGSAGSKGLVDVQSGATITADTSNSYVALVAPRVQQGGAVYANGPIGYVGAEQVDMTINAGMFNISILAGTTDPNGVVHTGTTGGPASTGRYADPQQITVVAMPKSTALTMLLSGSIGYAPALNAYDDGSAIVLSAGYDTPVPADERPDSLGHISIDNASFLNNLSGYATGSFDITAAGGADSFGGYAYLYALDAINVTLGNSEGMSVADVLSLYAGRNGAGGTIDVSLGQKAFLNVGNYFSMSASSYNPYSTAAYLDATGGKVTVDVNGGAISAHGMSADAYASGNYNEGSAGGIARGGAVSVTARNGGSITTDYLDSNVDAYGGSSDTVGGEAFGGSTSLTSQGGSLDLGSIQFDGQAYGGYGNTAGGAATGGKSTIALDGGTYSWAGLIANDSAFDYYVSGSQGAAATALADAISLTLTGGASLTAYNMQLNADAEGSFDAAAGTTVRGGGVNISVGNGSALNFTGLTVSADASVAAPSYYDSEALPPSTTPDTVGGSVMLTADGGTLYGQSVTLHADAYGLGAVDSAGSVHGGQVDMSVINGGSLTLFTGEGGGQGVDLSASAFGAIGNSAANAVGGTANLTISNASVNVPGTISVKARGAVNDYAILTASGTTPVGFNATGGNATLNFLTSPTGEAGLTAGNVVVDASADTSTPVFFAYLGEGGIYAGGPQQVSAGTATGGSANLNLSGGAFTADSASVIADGYGGLSASSNSDTVYRSGDGRGGTAAMTVSGGTNAITDVEISAVGQGGEGSSDTAFATLPSLAGDGFGGNASLTMTGGTLNAPTLGIVADGNGGAGGVAPVDSSGAFGTDGGNGTGGTAKLISTAGSTGQLTSPNVTLTAIGAGGAGGVNSDGTYANGGNGFGGTAGTQLADGSFSLGPLTISADGDGGDGGVGGEGSGGSAQFILTDSAAGPSGPRTIDGLKLTASGVGGLGAGGTAQSHAGTALLTVQAHDTSAGLAINGNLDVDVEGTQSAAGDGFMASISGAPVQVSGDTTIFTTRDATIASTTSIDAAGNLQIDARKLGGTGILSAGGTSAITADQGISLSKLSSGGTTTLLAANGPISVSTDLTSGGDVTASGRSIFITSSGALNFTTAQATGGGLRVLAAGDLTFSGLSATGAVNLASTGGLIASSAPATAGGAFNAAGANGVSFGTLTSGSTTGLNSSLGNIAVTDLTSAGAVTAIGQGVTLHSPGALTFANAQATAGDLTVSAVGNLTFATAGAMGALTFDSTAGSVVGTGQITASDQVSITGNQGIALTRLTSGGAGTSLQSPNGAVVVSTDLESSSPVTAVGRSVDITSLGALTYANAQATAGNLRLSNAYDLALEAASATGTVDLTSTNGAIVANSPISSGGAFAASGYNGATFGTLTSGGATSLTSANGPVTVADLNSAGLVTAVGKSVTLHGAGPLSFADAQATGGDLQVSATGDLSFVDAGATGNLNLTSTAGALTGTGQITSGGNSFISANRGVSLALLSSGGTTTLNAPNGAIAVSADLESVGEVSAIGRSIDITSFGSLLFSNAQATAGNVNLVTAGDLGVESASATGTIDLVSTGGSILTGGSQISSGGAFSASGRDGVVLRNVASGGSTTITSSDGAVAATGLTSAGLVSVSGQSVDVSGPGALSFSTATATAGDLALAAGGNLTLAGASATGAVRLDSAGTITSSAPVTSGGALSASGVNGLTFGRLSSGGATSLTSSNGAIGVSDLSSAGLVTAVGTMVTLNGAGPLSFADARATGGDLQVTSAGDLSFANASATGALDLTSTGGEITGTGQITAGGNASLSGDQGISLASLSSGGTTSLLAANGPVVVSTDLQSVGNVTAIGRSVFITSTSGLNFDVGRATGGGLRVLTAGDLAFDGLSATGAVNLASTSGSISSSAPVTSGGTFAAAGHSGVTFGTLTSGGATTLNSSNGLVRVDDLTSAGLVTAVGQGVTVRSSGALSFASAQATAGNLTIATGGDLTIAGSLTLPGASATGALTLSSSGGTVTGTGPILSGGNANVSGNRGVTLARLSSGGTTLLQAANGAVTVSNDLESTGSVTAVGRSVDISSAGALTFANARAVNGNLAIATAGDLTLQAASASGSAQLTSSGGAIKGNGPVTAGASFSASGLNGVAFGTLASGGTTALSSTGGAIAVSDLTSVGKITAVGRSIDISSSDALTFANARATAGDLRVTSAGDLAFDQGSAAGNFTAASSNGVVTAGGPLVSGGAFGASGQTGVALGTVTSGGTTSLASSNGAITVGDLASAGLVTAIAQSVTLNSSGALSFANARATGGDLRVTAASDLSFAQASATGAIGLSSAAGSLSASGPITAGGAVNLFGSTGVTLGALTSGGTTSLNGGSGALSVASLTSSGAVTAVGRSLDIASPGALTFSSVTATGGPARVSTAGNLAIGDGTVSGALTLASTGGVISSTGTVTAGGAVSIDGQSGVDFNRLSSGGATSLVSASGAIDVARLSSAGLVSVSGASVDIGTDQGLRFDTVNAAGNVSIVAPGDLQFNTVHAGADLLLDSTGGSLSAGGDVSGGYTRLLSADGITLNGGLIAGGPLSVDTAGAFALSGSASSDDASINANGGISMASLRSGEITRLIASGGNVVVGNLDTGGRVTAIGRDVNIRSTGGLNFDQASATAGNVFVHTDGDLAAALVSASNAVDLASATGSIHASGDVSGATLSLVAGSDIRADGNLVSGGALTASAGGIFALGGRAQGTAIGVTSGDIQLGSEAQLGVRGTTQSITLANNNGEATTYFGGAGATGGYSLDSTEATRLFADKSITLQSAGDIVVGNVQMSFGATGNIGTGGKLELTSPGTVEVSGAVDLTTSSDADTFTIDPTRIDVIAGEGSIGMHSGDTPQGTINLGASIVAVMSRSTRDAIAGMTDLAQISKALGAPAPAGPAGGYLEAGNINIDAQNALFIQNGGASDAFADRRGFTANALNITTGSVNTQIAINGLIIQNGTQFTGLDTIPLVTINGTAFPAGGQFDPKSTINGCVIGVDCGAPPPEPEPRPDLNPPTDNDLQGPVTPGNPGEGTLSGTLIQLEDNQPLISPPLVDEPITGVGNDDLWVPQCDPQAKDGGGCPQHDTKQ